MGPFKKTQQQEKKSGQSQHIKMKVLLLISAVIAVAYAERCRMHCPRNLRWVCAHDGKSYPNECVLRRAACMEKRAIVLFKQGKCLMGEKRCLILCPKIS